MCVAEVLKSSDEKLIPGTIVSGFMPYIKFQNVPIKGLNPLPNGIKSSYFLGALGTPGLSALLSLEKIATPKEGEVALVSGAAGAVGSAAG